MFLGYFISPQRHRDTEEGRGTANDEFGMMNDEWG
jgi:hypothetical protein